MNCKKQNGFDCRSIEFSKFKVIDIDEDDKIKLVKCGKYEKIDSQ